MHRRMSIPLLALAAMAGTGASVGGEPITISAAKREPMPVAMAPASTGPRKSPGSRASKRRRNQRRRGWR